VKILPPELMTLPHRFLEALIKAQAEGHKNGPAANNNVLLRRGEKLARYCRHLLVLAPIGGSGLARAGKAKSDGRTAENRA
jgi:hypothetical protein